MLKTLKHVLKRINEGVLKEKWEETIWVYTYVRRYWFMIVLYTIIGMVGSALSLFTSYFSKNLIDIITAQQTGDVVMAFCYVIGFSVGNICMTQFSSYVSNYVSYKVDNEIKADIFSKMLNTNWENLLEYHTGDLLSRWGADASVISSGVLNWIPNLIIYVFQFVSALVIVLYYDWTFAVFALLGIPVTLLMSNRLMKRMVRDNRRSAEMNAKLSGFHQETFSNIQTIKAFDLIKLYCQRLRQLQKEHMDMRLEFNRISMFTSILFAIVGLVVSYSCYGWGIYRVFDGMITYGTMTMFLTMSSTLTGSLNSLTSLVPSAIGLTTSARRLMEILSMPQDDYEDDEKVNEFLDKYATSGIGLVARNLQYSYATGTEVFDGAAFEAHPSEVIALVGPSGEGKTTMLRLLLSLLRTQGGELALSANEEELLLSPSTRKVFSYVPQGNTMFSGTIAENLRTVKEDATDEEIIQALKSACAYGFVSKLPDGIHSEIKERGGGFSEGQAQRLSIARALLRNSPILLLDEATSALDVATERQVLRNLMEQETPRTCIVTTHRPTVLSTCTRVYGIKDKKLHILNDEEIQELMDIF